MNVFELMKQAKDMQGKMSQLQEALGSQSVEGTSGGGMVRVTCTGKMDILSVTIDKATVDPEDVGMLEDLVKAAVNDALHQAKNLAAQEMSSLTGGLNIAGLFS
ncbi:YbaB/EbfC family nucleoid-associated protein [Desulfovibrio sp. OttesenSCG-928-G15]|nr:YbaB/EbfC family nucleoid-associated protein [Desulfovibrio sp. OttesenSCG-928-G15]